MERMDLGVLQMSNNRILVVCLGNICRSPAFEIILKDVLKKKRYENVVVESRGLSQRQAGKKIDSRIAEELTKRGYTMALPEKVSQLISKEDFFTFDYLFAVDQQVLDALNQMKPSDSKAVVDLVSCWSPDREEIFDPYKETDERMRQCIDLIEKHANHLVSHL